jgi:Flp pilus assembly protein TadD
VTESRHHNPPPRIFDLLPLLLVLAGALLYARSSSSPFLYDDQMHILNNPAIRGFDNPVRLLTADRRMAVSVSLAINYALGGDHPLGYHLFNVAVHLLAGLALYGLVWRTLELPKLRDRYADRTRPLAFFVALIWLAHPLCTQAVAYVIQRGESMMALCYLFMLYALARGTQRSWWYVVAVTACLVGMASKEVMVTAPAVALLYDRTFIGGSFLAALRKRWGVYLGLAATWLYLAATDMASILVRSVDAPTNVVGFNVPGSTPLTYLATQSAVIPHYLRLAIWPHPLVFEYAWPPASEALAYWPQSLAMIALVLLVAVLLWRRPMWGFFGAAFLIILSPTSSFVPIRHVIFEYRMYLPLVAIVAMMVFAADAWLPKRPAAIVGIIVALALGATTFARLNDYTSDVRLWGSVIEARPGNADARVSLGNALRRQGDLDGALHQYVRAAEINDAQVEAVLNIGIIYLDRGELSEAQHWIDVARRMKPDDAGILFNAGKVALLRGDDEQAESLLRRAIERDDEHVGAHDMLGVLMAKRGRLDQAAGLLQRAIEINPRYGIAMYNLAQVRADQGRMEEAVALLRQALPLLDARQAQAVRRRLESYRLDQPGR